MKGANEMKDLNYYLNLNYEMIVKKDSDCFVAHYKEFPRILGTGENEIEAISDLKDAFKCFVEISLKNGDKIKEPSQIHPSKNYAITMKTNIMDEIDKTAQTGAFSLSDNRCSHAKLYKKYMISNLEFLSQKALLYLY